MIQPTPPKNYKICSAFYYNFNSALTDWESQRDDIRAFQSTQTAYQKWQEQTLAYYAATSVECVQPEELSDEERIRRRNAYLENQYARRKEE